MHLDGNTASPLVEPVRKDFWQSSSSTLFLLFIENLLNNRILSFINYYRYYFISTIILYKKLTLPLFFQMFPFYFLKTSENLFSAGSKGNIERKRVKLSY